MTQTDDLNAVKPLNDEPRSKEGITLSALSPHPGRPKGSISANSKNPSAIAKAFKKAGLDWKADLAEAIKQNRRERIKMWLKLLPYLITTRSKANVKRWKGKPSKAARIALEAMEQEI